MTTKFGKKCIYCKSRKGIKAGFRNNKFGKKQVYFCKVCKRIFTPSDLYRNRKYPNEIIKNAYYLKFYEHLTLREISKSINKELKCNVSPSTVLYWLKDIDKYKKQIDSPTWAVFRKGQNFKIIKPRDRSI